METNTPTTVSKPKSKRSTRRKPSTVPPRVSAKAKRAAGSAAGTKKRKKASAKRAEGGTIETAEQRAERIAQAAYFLAEQRGFAPNRELDDWLAAERSL